MGGSTVRRSVFPIPVPSGEPPGLSTSGMSQRALKLVSDGCALVNDLFLGEPGSSRCASSVSSEPFSCIHSTMTCQANRMATAFDHDLVSSDCFDEICGGADYLGKATTAVPLDLDLLALPNSSVEPRKLCDLLGPSGKSIIERFELDCVNSQMTVAEARINTGLSSPYLDPSLRRDCDKYHRFVKMLWERGMLDASFDVVSSIGVFAVSKKGKKQRMVLDCRITNEFFGPAPRTSLPTAGAFCNISVPPDNRLHCFQFDLENAFYQLELPRAWRKWFALPEVPAGLLNVTQVDGHAVDPSVLVPLRMRVVPMGWSHALHWCQSIFTDIVKSSCPGIRILEDCTPIPPLVDDAVVSIYVDNLAVLSCDRELARIRGTAILQETHRRGLSTHELSLDTDNFSLLGMDFCGPHITPKGKRRWRLYYAISQALTFKMLTSRQLSAILGHFTFQGLLRRELLSTMRACYVFIQKDFHRPSRLWTSVVRELTWMRSSLMFVEHDMSLPWSGEVFCYDASPWGCGVVRGRVAPHLAQTVGQYSEKWRFKNRETVSLRRLSQKAILQHVFVESGSDAMAVLSDKINKGRLPADVLDEIEINSEFIIPLVPRVLNSYLGAEWRTCVSAPWTRHEHISVLECRALVSALCLNLSRPNTHHRHWLLLSDSIACILSNVKGRSSKPGMCRAIRQITAILLCCSIKMHLRWIPSELNVADEPSRRGLRHGGSKTAARGSWQWPEPPGVPAASAARRPRVSDDESTCPRAPRRSATGPDADTPQPSQAAAAGRRPAAIVAKRSNPPAAHGGASCPGIAAGDKRSGARRRGVRRAWQRLRAESSGDAPALGLAHRGGRRDLCPARAHESGDSPRAQAHEKTVPTCAVVARMLGHGHEPEPDGRLSGDISLHGPELSGQYRKLRRTSRRLRCSIPRCLLLGRRALRYWRTACLCSGMDVRSAPTPGCRTSPEAGPSSEHIDEPLAGGHPNAASRADRVCAGHDDVLRAVDVGVGDATRCHAGPGPSLLFAASGTGQLDVAHGRWRPSTEWKAASGADIASARDEQSLQDGRFRRDRYRRSPVACPPAARLESSQPTSGSVAHSASRSLAIAVPGSTGAAPSACNAGATDVVCFETLRPLCRRVGGPARTDGDPTAREVEGPLERAPLPKGRKTSRTLQQVFAPDPAVRRAVRERAPRGARAAMQAFAASLGQALLRVQVVLELFSGSGRFSRAAAAAGECVLSIDLQFGFDTNDLLSPQLQRDILGWIQAGWIKYMLSGFCCQSFSKARNIPGGPPPLRAPQYVLGLPDLCPADARKVAHGNSVVRFVVRLAHACLANKVPSIVENPFTSWAWQIPSVVNLLQCKHVQFSRVDFCQYGTPWQKATGFLTTFMQPQIFARVCHCKTGLCSFSGCKHRLLRGKDSNGIHRTHHAEPYPHTLCTKLVTACRNAAMSLQAENLDKLFCKLI